ncbi:MAG: SH3 domain-containing protein [Pirellulales bacterium]|nr:SH3 domain-containing protein [Pirellulales bacterium]
MHPIRCNVVSACALIAAIVLADRAQCAEGFPYTAYANSDDIYVRSGPGKNYYPTDKLAKGTAVEVYRHDPGGWYAIRPPEGSFSWVPADALKPTGSGLAVVLKNRTSCFVGTSFSSARDVHQVRLDQGEEVEILDIKQVGEGENTQSWCQISPPAGEFRWVFGKYFDRELPSGISSSKSARSDLHRKPMDPVDADRAKVRAKYGAVWSEKSGDANQASKLASSEPPDVSSTASDPLHAELQSLDLALSTMVSDDTSAWEFTGLRRRGEVALERADTAIERGKVRLILNRIARFEDIKRRHDLLGLPQNSSMIAAARPPVMPVDEPVRFDGVGKLTPVVAQRPNAPRYALVNDQNQVVAFVTPSPGINMQPYIGKQVGINGQRGYMPELRKPHVTAQRVSVTDGTVIR